MTHWDIDRTSGGRVTVRDLLVDAERRLSGVGIESASVDAAEIIALVMGTTRSRLIMQDVVDPDRRVRIEQLLTKRQSRIPLQHLTGSAPFRRIEVQVGPGVFIPRPETELVTEAGIRELATSASRIAVDLGSGSGAIALSLALAAPR
ncbi:MAG: peptide chain release factor N(5)-glutamine methyltransferase, partial [Actinomycetales bacterium]